MRRSMLALLTSAVALLAGHAAAQTTYLRDQRGVITSRAEQQGSTTWFRDQRGIVTGRAERKGDAVEFHDAQGRYLVGAGNR